MPDDERRALGGAVRRDTEMRPVDAPAGTFAVIVESEMTVNVVAAIFLNVTAVAPLSPTPLSVTTSPTSPDRGSPS